MFKIFSNLRKDDPVFNCDLYKDKSFGSCSHVDGPLCDFPTCSMLDEYKSNKPGGITIANDIHSELRNMYIDIKNSKYNQPVPYA